jgi:hypothetical protein
MAWICEQVEKVMSAIVPSQEETSIPSWHFGFRRGNCVSDENCSWILFFDGCVAYRVIIDNQ